MCQLNVSNSQNCCVLHPNRYRKVLDEGGSKAVSRATIQLTDAILGANSVLSAGEYVEVTNIDSGSSTMTVIKAGMGGLTATSNRLQCLSRGMFEVPPTCQACQAGYYLPPGQDKECQPCEAGKFSERIASSACLNCPQGFYSPGTSGEPGFSNHTIARSCTFCDKLGYTTTPGVSGKSYSGCNVCDKGYELLSGSCSVCRRECTRQVRVHPPTDTTPSKRHVQRTQ